LADEYVSPGAIVQDVQARGGELARLLLGPVINATGVVLHTNLGRAPLSEAAVLAASLAAGAVNLELDLAAGERGSRAPAAEKLLCALTGSEAALVVNNNAGALVLALAVLARGREVIVSRGELIEIGGEFRLPSIMEVSGAVLREVGTTNRTRASDVRGAIADNTGLILKVHPSNYRILGFTDEAALGDLAFIAREAGVPLLHDIGSGLLTPDERFPGEPDATTSLQAGADLVCFSGDKLLGGPQAGVIAGRAALVAACRRHPLARALRADKMSLAAMEATLLAHARGDRSRIPIWRMLELTPDDIRPRAASMAAATGGRCAEGESLSGGGSLPGLGLPTVLVAVDHERPADVARALRRGTPPVVARVENGALVIDMRTVDPKDDAALEQALRAAL
ncbi:MAG: L-seryl-tRNA(Sec) selenium transferase, partial [Actinobacteria bacterium]|nr:L-seryl-tRNA(Sec) selenium transferase [Actinomycetota bacterium]